MKFIVQIRIYIVRKAHLTDYFFSQTHNNQCPVYACSETEMCPVCACSETGLCPVCAYSEIELCPVCACSETELCPVCAYSETGMCPVCAYSETGMCHVCAYSETELCPGQFYSAVHNKKVQQTHNDLQMYFWCIQEQYPLPHFLFTQSLGLSVRSASAHSTILSNIS